jgi:AAA domain
MTAPGPRNGTCVRPPHPENAEHAAGDDQVVVMAADSPLSRFARWVAYAPAERAPLPAIPAAWTAAEIMHMAAVPAVYPGMGAVAAAGLAYGLAARRQGSQDGDDDSAEKLSPAEVALLTGGTAGWLALGDAAGPLSGGWPPWVSLSYLAAAGVAWAWLKMHPATRGARARKEAAELAAALDTARKTQWHQLAAMIGLRGSHLLKYEETYLGDRRLVDTRGTGKRASALATAHLAEHLAELEGLPKGRVDVYPDAIAGRLWIDTRRIDPWRRPAMHPAASGQLDPAAEFAQFTPPKATIREPVSIGIDPDTGAPLQVKLWDPRDGAKVITVIAKKGGGKTVLLDNLTERITACDDAVLIQVNLSKALEDRWWELLSAASALDGNANLALMILNFIDQLITHRPRGGRTTRVHQPTPDAPLYVLKLDEIDRLASIPDAKQLLQLITSKCRSEGVTLIMAGQRGTAQWTGGGDVQSQVDIAIYGKFARDSRERGHVAGADANLPSMSEYGEGHPGVFGVTDLPPEGEVDKGRTFYWGESSGGIQRLIAARARTRRPLRQLEPALRALQPLWDAITSAAVPAGGYDDIASPPAAAAVAPGQDFTRPDVQFGAAGQVVPGTEQTRAKIGAALDSLAAADQTVAAVADVDDGQWAAAVAQRQAQALAQNYGDVDVPGPVMQVLTRLLADPDGTTAQLAGEAIKEATGTGSKSLAHRYLQALRVAGIARLDGSGRGARFRLATSPVPASPRPGLTVVPEDDTAQGVPPAMMAALLTASAGPAGPAPAGPESTEAAVNRLLGDAIRLVTEFEFASEKFLTKRLRCQPHEAAGLIGALQALNIIRPDPEAPGAFDAAVTARDITAAITGQPSPPAAAGGDAQ